MTLTQPKLASKYVSRDRAAGCLGGLALAGPILLVHQGGLAGRPGAIPKDEALVDTCSAEMGGKAHGVLSNMDAHAIDFFESLFDSGTLDGTATNRLMQVWQEARSADAATSSSHFSSQSTSTAAAGNAPAGESNADPIVQALLLALWHTGDVSELVGLAMPHASLSQRKVTGQLLSSFCSLWGRRLILGDDDAWRAALDDARSIFARETGRPDEWRQVESELGQPPDGSGSAINVVRRAKLAIERNESFHDSTQAALGLGPNSIASAAAFGAIAGLHFGYYGIDSEWRRWLEEQGAFKSLLKRLLEHRLPHSREDDGLVRTSETHPLQIGTLSLSEAKGQLGVTFCPGKHQADAITGAWQRDLDMDLNALWHWGARHLVTLIEPHELEELGVSALPERAAAHGIAWHHAPITDGSIPDSRFEQRWASIGPTLFAALRAGESVVVHCKGGLGRAGTVAARILMELGDAVSPEDAIQRVREVRPHAVETVCQEHFLQKWSPTLST